MKAVLSVAPSDTTLATLLVLFVGILLRACVALRGYSGEGTPPMFGDFEAQRHWMEVTVNLPPTAWYAGGKDNDLQYWGLDYPPVSAYLSWAIGRLAQACGHPELVALHTSRGHESEATRVFMRRSVIACDVLVFLPAAVACTIVGVAPGRARLGLLALLCALPPLVLVDHGHFQYNCVSLGLALWAAHAAMMGWPLACSVAFSLALNFKQMSLYLAPAFFCYLLSGCLRARGAAAAPGNTRTRRAVAACASVAKLGVVVICTFGLCWLPFLGSASDAAAVLRRLFPVGRQLYEDKVANVWCTLALLPGLKLKQRLPINVLLTLTTSMTLCSLLPPCALLLARPSRRGFLLCATACGLGFFLLSFQVHEKHVLLPLLPALLLAPSRPVEIGWLVSLCTFSLYPLLVRDGQAPCYAVLQALWPLLCHVYAAEAAPAAAPPPSPTAKAAEPKAASKGMEPKTGFSPRKSVQKAFITIDAGIDAGIDALGSLFKDEAKEKAEAEAEAKAAAEAAAKLKADAEASSLLAWYERRGVRLLPVASAAGMLALHAAEALVTPPARYPDLHSVLFAAYSCAHLVAAYVAIVYCQWRISATEPPHTPLDVPPSPTPEAHHLNYLAPTGATAQSRLKAA